MITIQIQNKTYNEVTELMAILRENGYDPYLSGTGTQNVVIKPGVKN